MRTRLSIGLALLSLTAMLPFAAAARVSAAATANVRVADTIAFIDAASNTSTTTITAGDMVLWTWDGAIPHSVTADDASFDSNPPNGSQSSGTFSRTFSTPGTYKYYCRIHSTPGGTAMNGTIVVQAVATPTTVAATATSTAAATATPTAQATATQAGATPTASGAATGTPASVIAPAPASSSSTAAAATQPAGAGAGASLPGAGDGTSGGAALPLRWLALGGGVLGALALAAAAHTRRRPR